VMKVLTKWWFFYLACDDLTRWQWHCTHQASLLLKDYW